MIDELSQWICASASHNIAGGAGVCPTGSVHQLNIAGGGQGFVPLSHWICASGGGKGFVPLDLCIRRREGVCPTGSVHQEEGRGLSHWICASASLNLTGGRQWFVPLDLCISAPAS